MCEILFIILIVGTGAQVNDNRPVSMQFNRDEKRRRVASVVAGTNLKLIECNG